MNLLRDCDWREKSGLGSSLYHKANSYITSHSRMSSILRVLDILRQERGVWSYRRCFNGPPNLCKVALKYYCDILQNTFDYTENSSTHSYQQLKVFSGMFVFSEKCGHARSIGDGSKSMFESIVV